MDYRFKLTKLTIAELLKLAVKNHIIEYNPILIIDALVDIHTTKLFNNYKNSIKYSIPIEYPVIETKDRFDLLDVSKTDNIYYLKFNNYMKWLNNTKPKGRLDLLTDVKLTNRRYIKIKEHVNTLEEQRIKSIHVYDDLVYNNVEHLHKLSQLTTKQKYNLILKGRTIEDIPRNIATQYNNIQYMLMIEKYIFTIIDHRFKDHQIDNIFNDPINLLIEIVRYDDEHDIQYLDNQTILEYILMMYNPDAYYNGKTFVELVNSIISFNEEHNIDYSWLKDYNYYVDSLLNNLISPHIFTAKYTIGILKVLYSNNNLTLDNLDTMFYQLKNFGDNKYVKKFFLFILNTDLKRFNINPANIKVGKGKNFPFTLFINTVRNKKRKLFKPVNRIQHKKREVNDEKEREVKESIKETYIRHKKEYKALLLKRASYTNNMDYIENRTLNVSIKDDLGIKKYTEYVTYVKRIKLLVDKIANLKKIDNTQDEELDFYTDILDKYIKKIDDLTDVYTGLFDKINLNLNILKNNIEDYINKYKTSNVLGLFIIVNDYESVNTLLKLGIDPNSYHTTDMYPENNILESTSFKMLKYLYKNGADINVFMDNDANIYTTVARFNTNIIPAFFWLLTKVTDMFPVTTETNMPVNIMNDVTLIIKLIYNGLFNHVFNLDLINDLKNIVLSYVEK